MRKKGLLFILSAPAGTGKTTVVRELQRKNSQIVQSISYTSRSPRPGEVDGKDYFFVSREEFQKKLTDGHFLEHAELHGNCYGTDRFWVQEQLASGSHLFLVIDTQGALQLRCQKIDAVTIFLLPPTLEELERRLRQRRTESEEHIAARLRWAQYELSYCRHYDYLVVNREVDEALRKIETIISAEELRTAHFFASGESPPYLDKYSSIASNELEKGTQ